MFSRRGLVTGIVSSLIAAPAIVRAASLMPVRNMLKPSLLVPIEFRVTFQDHPHLNGSTMILLPIYWTPYPPTWIAPIDIKL
jgi:hypothetical protein